MEDPLAGNVYAVHIRPAFPQFGDDGSPEPSSCSSDQSDSALE
ncbi:hypothetical protein FBZ94_1102 [Bradyrhizobium sacchari]|uniref:Uncharacterized protein n=1 Tax=Bradyrhizobium sacchari TaxID=1399419 RepID=A0A560JEF0_9BRAD|nr:hypothetical protein FBZ94_1102 [Bradyrhizobium sacchari]TWB69406.1 hypothetical protein FBZ95_1092 [Bradyrhizobium sacchari]